jgi:hypothetical protein
MNSRFRLSARNEAFVTLLYISRVCYIYLDSCVRFDAEVRSGAKILLASAQYAQAGSH